MISYSVGQDQEGDAVDQVDRVDPDSGDEGDGGTHWGEAVTTATTTPRPGDLAVSPGVGILRGPLVGSEESTPLEEDEPEGIVPPSPLWAMKDRRHVQWHLLPSHERHERVRDCIGAGDWAIYVVDDGRHHVMLGRRVGRVAGECEYSLVGRATRDHYDALRADPTDLAGAFDGATELTLCGVAEEESILSSNVFDVDRYDDAAAIPAAYRPGAPYVELTEALEIAVD
jgi:hypothetical protein